MLNRRKSRPESMISTPNTVSSSALAAAATIGKGQQKKSEGSLLNRRNSYIKPKIETRSTTKASIGNAFDNFDGAGTPQDNYNITSQPKMVKRYIPTAQGVKVIEVPQESFDSQLQRSNSMRVGMNITRTGSMQKSVPRSNSGFRTSSLSGANSKPRGSLDASKAGYSHFSLNQPSKTRNATLNKRQSLDSVSSAPSSRKTHQKVDSISSMEQELNTIDEEIKKQKILQEQLNLKKQEYLNLKSQNSKNLSELSQYQNMLDTTIDEGDEKEKDTVLEKLPEDSSQDKENNKNIDSRLPNISDYHHNTESKVSNNIMQQSNENTNSISNSNPNEAPVGTSTGKNDLVDYDHDGLSNKVDELHDVTVISDFHDDSSGDHDFKSDEYKQNDILPQYSNHTSSPYNSNSLFVSSIQPQSSTSSNYDGSLREMLHKDNAINSSSNVEIGIIKQYIDDKSNDVDSLDDTENFTHKKSQLAESLRPKFNDAPQIIQNEEPSQEYHNNFSESLSAPKVLSGGSSISSIRSNGSLESPNKKPLKSALKNSHSNVSLIRNKEKKVEKKNPAHDAYLSLATSENTKLNAKLSANNLSDPYSIQVNQSQSQYQKSNQQQDQSKRMSHSLRQPTPPQQQQQQQKSQHNLSKKTLRPQSMQNNDLSERKGMSNRNLRNSVYVAPIAAHPALKPGYQSPSKLKAQELYAKANARPKSQFAPLQRKSSFSKVVDEELSNHQSNNKKAHDQVMERNSGFAGFHRSQKEHQQQQQQQQQQQKKNPAQSQRNPKMLTLRNKAQTAAPIQNEHKEYTSGVTGGFKSRFADSDDDEDNILSSHHQVDSKPTYNSVPQMTSLREDKKQSSEPPKEKKKFGKLRKLFGKSK